MRNKSKLIVFIIIIVVSIGGLVIKGYFNNQVYVLNEENQVEDNNQDEIKEDTEKQIVEKEITIYISGEVKNPGVVTLKNDKRLSDAVKLVGGVTNDADLNNINLALKLEDEMHYIIPKKGEIISNSSNSVSLDNNSTNENGKININTATIEQLDQIPGVGEATANKILNYREEVGSFKRIEEIKNVSGIGDKKYENMKEFICI